MGDFLTDELRKRPEWRSVLAAYRSRQAARKGRDADYDGWSDRISGVDGVDDAHLPRIHGKLIALGLLHFQLSGRSAGVQYRVSPLGSELLEGRAEAADDAEERAAAA